MFYRGKNAILLLIFSAISSYISAQSPGFEWAKSAGGTSDEMALGMAKDASGNYYITGYTYSSVINFESLMLGSAGNADIIVAKYSSNGNLLWARIAGGAGEDKGQCITVDNDNNLYVAGYFSSPTITFGGYTLTNGGLRDMFIVKYNSAGNVLWAISSGSAANDAAKGIAADNLGNIYVSGEYINGSITFGATTLPWQGASGTPDIFLTKYNAAGSIVWSKFISGTNQDFNGSLTVDGFGNPILGGQTISTDINIGGTIYPLINSGYDNYVMNVKYSPIGVVLWVNLHKCEGPPGGGGFLTKVTADRIGNIYCTGYFQSHFMLVGPDTLINVYTQYTGEPSVDGFLIKYRSDGSYVWARSLHGSFGVCMHDRGFGLGTDSIGNVYISGDYCSPLLYFDNIQLSNDTSFLRIFIAKYDTTGHAIWAISAGGRGRTYCFDMVTDSAGNCAVTGSFNTPTTFGSYVLSNVQWNDLYFAKTGNAITGIISPPEEYHLYPFPNPSNGRFRIKGISNTTFILRITDVMGKCVHLQKITSSQQEINLSSLPHAIYFYDISKNNRIVKSGKLIR